MRIGYGLRPPLSLPVATLLVLLALLWPALANGGAFLFPDTTAYVRGADAAAATLLHRPSRWSDELAAPAPALAVAGQASPARTATAPVPVGERVVLAGRSVYYGALLYLTLLARSFWPLVLLQAALTALATVLTIARFAPREGGVSAGAAVGWALVAALTPAGFYSAFAMPDIFAALAVLASAHVALAWRRQRGAERTFWLGLLVAGALFHSATLLILAALATMLIGLRLAGRACPEGRLWPLLLAVLIAGGGEALFSGAVKRLTGEPPVRPPFLTARLIEDGPGMRYLRAHCGEPDAPLVCRYRSRLPLPSDAFLWATDDRHGVFKSLPPADQRALAAADRRFGAQVLRAEPMAVVGAMLRDAARQAVTVGLGEFNYGPDLRATFATKVPAPERDALAGTAAYRDRMPTAPVAVLALPLAVLSLALVALAAVRRRRLPATHLAAWLVVGVALNDAICGAVSGPHDRYGARMIWLLPLAATVLLGAWRARRTALPAR